jgi:hypothetical protein
VWKLRGSPDVPPATERDALGRNEIGQSSERL